MTLFGRETELEVLLGLLDGVSEQAGVRLIHGEAGVGKSALLEAAGHHARARGMLVLRTSGAEFEAQMPFAALQHLLGGLIGLAGDLIPSQRQALLDAFGSAMSPPDTFMIALASLSLLSDCAARTPMAILVDDAHWLDAPTIDVLRFIARRLDADQIVLLISYRDGYGATLEDPNLSELAVGRLGPEAAAQLLDSHAPELVPAIRERVLSEAEGNPLALLELPIALRDSHTGWSHVDAVPLTNRLQQAFGTRVADLPKETQALLLVAALHATDLLAEILRATSLLADERLALEGLDLPEATRLVTSDGARLRFNHPLIRAAVRKRATLRELRQAHAALAQTLSNEPDRALWHLAACASGPDELLAARLEAAAERTRERRGTDVALLALRRSAELTEDAARRGQRLLAAAELALDLGRPTELVDLLGQAEPLPLTQRDRHCLFWLREALADASGMGTIESTVSLACRLIDDGDTRLALNALLTAAVKCHRFNAAQGPRESVVEAADLLGLPAEDAKLLAIYALATPAQLGMTIVQRLAGVSPSDPGGVASGSVEAAENLHMYALALTMVPEFRLAAQFHEAAIDSLRAQGRLGLLSRALASHAVTGLALGDWRLARNAAEECLVLASEPDLPSARSPVAGGHQAGRRQLDSGTARLVLGAIAANRGDNEAAERLIDAGARVLAPLGDNFSFAMVQAARAAAALASGDSSDAFAHARRVFDPADPAHNWQVCRWRTLVMDFVDAAWLSGNETQAKRVVAALASEPCGVEFGSTLYYARTILGEEGRLESEHGTTGDRPASAYVQARLELARGVRLRRSRQGREARPHLRAAQEGFDSVGATPWAEHASQELRASGETSRRRTPAHRDELSPQEQQIALLAADGLSNREIAARLFLSHRTVGAHLYHLFPKLGISSRVELKDALQGRGAVGVGE